MGGEYLQLNMPRRGRFYFAFGVGLIFWDVLSVSETSLLPLAGLCFFLGAMVWLCFRTEATGMEIRDGRWSFFVGPRQWSVPLREVSSVRVLGQRSRPEGLALTYRDGHTDVLPASLATRLDPLEQELARRGIPLDS